jgi:hypothetical protein
MQRVAFAVVGGAVATGAAAAVLIFAVGLTIGLVEIGFDGLSFMFVSSAPSFLPYLGVNTLIALVATVIWCLPWHRFASQRRWTKAIAYCGPSAGFGLLLSSLLVLPVWISGAKIGSAELGPVLALFLWPYCVVFGALSGLFFWLIRRPDRDAANPATPAP